MKKTYLFRIFNTLSDCLSDAYKMFLLSPFVCTITMINSFLHKISFLNPEKSASLFTDMPETRTTFLVLCF